MDVLLSTLGELVVIQIENLPVTEEAEAEVTEDPNFKRGVIGNQEGLFVAQSNTLAHRCFGHSG